MEQSKDNIDFNDGDGSVFSQNTLSVEEMV